MRVDVTAIERQLAELWRAEKNEDERAVTRAALWNVVAHTWTPDEHARATEVLARASARVPQRTIVVRADPAGAADIASWISANCHVIGGGKQVCSEEVVIVAAGERVHHIPPLVSALLLPDMPVAVWWLGDLPNEQHGYVETLLDPADRLIVDSSHFNGAADLELVSRIGEQTTTAPADLNWARVEEWRAATAALFDPPSMRERMRNIRKLRVISGGDASFGANAEGLLYAAWLTAQSGTEIAFELAQDGHEAGIGSIEIHFDDSVASIRHDRERGVVIASSDGIETSVDCITRSLARESEDLIVRLLKRPEADRVYLKTLKIARRLAA
ncbi:MAG TPA: glucose-6-phosphate dehydrogenase assembly protein OpcA [Thermoanaerobaculia bacterium]|nr:glucose-6-phosphate dehydrogenase assembly protein OpcA [Thermoanaerobaculia bacterium]